MKKEYIEAGKIVGTHGVRGMVRIKPWADNGDFLCGFKTLYANGKTPLNINTIKPHGNVVIAEIEGINSIEKAETLRNQVVYIKRSDADIPDGRYFVSEIIGSKVYDFDTGKEYGVLTEVSVTGANDVWHIKSGDREYLLPAINEVVKDVDIEKDEIKISPMKGIFDDEN